MWLCERSHLDSIFCPMRQILTCFCFHNDFLSWRERKRLLLKNMHIVSDIYIYIYMVGMWSNSACFNFLFECLFPFNAQLLYVPFFITVICIQTFLDCNSWVSTKSAHLNLITHIKTVEDLGTIFLICFLCFSYLFGLFLMNTDENDTPLKA